MAARQYYYAESNAQSTTTSGSNQNKVTVNFTPDASSDYFAIASWVLNYSSTSAGHAEAAHQTASSDITINGFMLPVNVNDYLPMCSVAKISYGGSPAAQAHSVVYKADGTRTTAIKQARVAVIKANAADQSAEDLTQSTTTSATFQDKLTLTFTPGTTGDYIIFTSAILGVASANDVPAAVLDIDGTDYGEASYAAASASARYSWGIVKRINLSNASHTIKIQYRRSLGTTAAVNIQQCRIVAMRADAFDANYYGENTSANTTTSTTFQDDATLTDTPNVGAHLNTYCAAEGGNLQATASVIGQLLEAAATISDMQSRNRFGVGNPLAVMAFQFTVETLANSSTTWKAQYKSETGGVSVQCNYSAISVAQLNTTPVTGGLFGRSTLDGLSIMGSKQFTRA